jgi:hypothetical protein
LSIGRSVDRCSIDAQHIKIDVGVLCCDCQTNDWKAVSRWNDRQYLVAKLPSIVAHAPRQPVVRMHHVDALHPLSEHPAIEWTQPWQVCRQVSNHAARHVIALWCVADWQAHVQEYEISTHELFKAQKLLYIMRNVLDLPQELLEDVGSVDSMSVVWSPPLEINVWMGTPTVTTPAHFGMHHHL